MTVHYIFPRNITRFPRTLRSATPCTESGITTKTHNRIGLTVWVSVLSDLVHVHHVVQGSV